MCAPSLRVASTLLSGAVSGITMVAWMPSRCALMATPCAWLPALAATTPRLRSFKERGAVQVFQLEMDPGSAQLAEGLGERAGGDRHDSADAVARREDVLQVDHRGGRVTASAIPVKMWCGMKAHASRVV